MHLVLQTPLPDRIKISTRSQDLSHLQVLLPLLHPDERQRCHICRTQDVLANHVDAVVKVAYVHGWVGSVVELRTI